MIATAFTLAAVSFSTSVPLLSQDRQGPLRTGARSDAWVQYPGCGRDIAVGPDGQVWVIGCTPAPGGYAIYRLAGSGPDPWRRLEGGAVRIAAGFGRAWVVNDTGLIFAGGDLGGWTQYPGCARDIAVSGAGPAGGPWVIGCTPTGGGFAIYQYVGSFTETWRQIPGGGVRIAVDRDQRPWVVNDQGWIWAWRSGGTWDRMPGCANDIAIGGDREVWVVGCTRVNGGQAVYRWRNGSWQQVDGGATNIAVGPDGRPWVVNDIGLIYQLR